MSINMASHSKEDVEDLDYMSDLFIAEIAKAKPKRPSAPKRLQQKKKSFSRKGSSGKLEQQAREDGLAKPISVENKGYSLLCKMGYVEGETLGKSGSGGRVNPISVTVKEDRLGLGRESFIKEKDEKEKELQDKQLSDFRHHCLSQSAQRRIRSDLKKSRQTCEHLDTINGYSEPIASWYWLSTCAAEEREVAEESDEEAPPNDEEQLQVLINYLRSHYFYCLYCGSEYASK
ncbi:PREDICTED: G patch domain-containing protein 11-like [Amphimedon queenslandica]|uniref:G patch domain-containing protein 11 n=1 Tax=Amphimedon queenslandica TaxID=400682 RepID=A0AAN0J0N5_AMPQE|nr:PREDICTED: G patch domain-containing protein 11-like [Amphimedon queenslandica]|eukprot:XP_019850560.1 PREDICTED: G patch domain-containing protein 11-like [Amphimedon queenslandica]